MLYLKRTRFRQTMKSRSFYKLPLYPHTIAHILTKLEAKYGFKHVSCHGLRHTYCSLLLSQNVPIQTVSKYMGHSDSTVTLEVYSHFIPDTQEKVVFALNNISKKWLQFVLSDGRKKDCKSLGPMGICCFPQAGALGKNTALPYWRTEDGFTKECKKMADARLHSPFLVLLTGIEPITNP